MVTEDTLRPDKSHQCRSLHAHGSLLRSNPSALFSTLLPRGQSAPFTRGGEAPLPLAPLPLAAWLASPTPLRNLRSALGRSPGPHHRGSLFLQPNLHSRGIRRTPLSGSPRFTLRVRGKHCLLGLFLERRPSAECWAESWGAVRLH